MPVSDYFAPSASAGYLWAASGCSIGNQRLDLDKQYGCYRTKGIFLPVVLSLLRLRCGWSPGGARHGCRRKRRSAPPHWEVGVLGRHPVCLSAATAGRAHGCRYKRRRRQGARPRGDGAWCMSGGGSSRRQGVEHATARRGGSARPAPSVPPCRRRRRQGRVAAGAHAIAGRPGLDRAAGRTRSCW